VTTSGPDADDYAHATGQDVPSERIPVVVQAMLAPVAAGVAFTEDPLTGAAVTVVEAVPGLGSSLVSGARTPHRVSVDHTATVRSSCASAGMEILTPQQVRRIAGLAHRAEQLFGASQDVEWALTADGRIWLLQARPITTRATPGIVAPARPDTPGRVLAHGVPASPGTASGRLRVITGLDEFARFRPGEVLVCRATSPAWTPLLARACGVVTEVGGILSHAAIVARELRLPAVTEVLGATQLPDGLMVEIDGSAGTVRPGVRSGS